MTARINLIPIREKIDESENEEVFDYEEHKKKTLQEAELVEKLLEIKGMLKEMNFQPYSSTMLYKQNYQKQYYEKVNKERNKNRADYYCECCKKSIQYFSKNSHFKSAKHIANAAAAAAKQ